MSYANYIGKTKDELVKILLDLKKKQMEIRFKHAGGQLETVHELRTMRRDIARVQTAMTAPATETKKAAKKPAAKKTTKKTEKAA
jgi:large subunit ribosomal protein L29